MVKLFIAQLYDRRDYVKTMLIVAEENRLQEKVREMGYNYCTAQEISEIDGYKIEVKPKIN